VLLDRTDRRCYLESSREAALALGRLDMDIWQVIDLFSGAGGMSFGFRANPRFKVTAAVDVEVGKPSTGFGALECNRTYRANVGIQPLALDLAEVSGQDLSRALAPRLEGRPVTVLCACPPCTGFSRTVAANHLRDDPRNSLVARTALFVEEFGPDIVFMENARELITGNFSEHFATLRRALESLGYRVEGATHFLSKFGLPQQRERALVTAVKKPRALRTLDDLWEGYGLRPEALTVRRGIGKLPVLAAGATDPADDAHTATDFSDELTRARIAAVPHDGGGWIDLLHHPRAEEFLTPNMWRLVELRRTNSYCDIYGRMWWDRPAPTIKRECCHVGNGRYAHPEQDRLCTVREMAILQGFPAHYRFVGRSRKNLYRQVGDAVPPLISFQLAALAEWMLTGERPQISSCLLPGTQVHRADIVEQRARQMRFGFG
jgi:DNA (cytosine-5)-methyltransferase 1